MSSGTAHDCIREAEQRVHSGLLVFRCAHQATFILLIAPSKLARSLFRDGGCDLPLRAPNEGLRRPRVARATEVGVLAPPLVSPESEHIGGRWTRNAFQLPIRSTVFVAIRESQR